MRFLLSGVVAVLLATGPAFATAISYDFTGDGSITIGNTDFTGAFSIDFTGDTADVTSGGGEFFNHNVTGVFTADSMTFDLAPGPFVVVNTDPSFPRMGFFNTDVTDGGTLQDSSFSSYELASDIGPITVTTGPDLLPTTGGSFMATDGTDISFTAMTSLTFQSTVSAVPEPATWVLMVFGFLGIAPTYFRRQRQRANA